MIGCPIDEISKFGWVELDRSVASAAAARPQYG
jgi:hypothetical protein